VENQLLLHILDVFSVALGIQHTKGTRSVILLSVAYLAVLHISAVFHKDHNLKKKLQYKICILILSAIFVRNISHFKKNSARYYRKCTYVSYKAPVILARF
jgi:hypothetical protein